MLHEHYWFCQPHAAEYNRNWNFFAGLSEGEIRRRQDEEMMTGGRPTWEMKAGRLSGRPPPSPTSSAGPGRLQGLPRALRRPAHGGQAGARAPSSGQDRAQRLADLDLDDDADGPKIRARYTELVRRLHPDANQGDRSGEHRLQRVIRAYQSLRKVGMV
jgi:hypothetical protein